MSFEQMLDEFVNQESLFRNEGETGVANLEKMLNALGYNGHAFRFGTPIEEFLADNSGAIEAIIEFITEWGDRCPEWQARLESHLKE